MVPMKEVKLRAVAPGTIHKLSGSRLGALKGRTMPERKLSEEHDVERAHVSSVHNKHLELTGDAERMAITRYAEQHGLNFDDAVENLKKYANEHNISLSDVMKQLVKLQMSNPEEEYERRKQEEEQKAMERQDALESFVSNPKKAGLGIAFIVVLILILYIVFRIL